jgi:hypothetical protein
LQGINNLKSIGGYFGVAANHLLPNLIGLNSLQTIGTELNISNNQNLKTLTGLNNLTALGGDFYVGYMKNLKDFKGLENLRTVGGFVYISNLDSLESLSPIANMTTTNENNYITVQYNARLSNCTTQAICQKISRNSSNLTLTQNAVGCNSANEIKPLCRTLKTNELEKYNLKIAPNPVQNSVFLEIKNAHPQISLTVEVFDLLGKRVLSDKITPDTEGGVLYSFSVENWQTGMYIAKVSNNTTQIQEKIIKQ